MRIRRKFIQLTKNTYPHGTEEMLESYLPKGYSKDIFDNYYIKIGDSSTMFTCHLDTAASYQKTVKHIFDRNYVKTDGTTILGADDKAGMTVMLYMIENKVPGLYYFFIGEEVGCIGSSSLSMDPISELDNITKCISFDRRGTSSIITEQMFGECCSSEFALELSNRLNSTKYGLKLYPDDTGVMTDSAQFIDIIPECTNISVGYYNEHTVNEKQDLAYLSNLCKACIEVDWETLPISRNPKEKSYYNRFLSSSRDVSYYYDKYYMKKPESYTSFNKNSDYNEYDPKFFTYVVQRDNVLRKMCISQTWINYEKTIISSWLSNNDYYPTVIEWDGNSCWIEQDGVEDYLGSREDLCAFIYKLGEVPDEHLKEFDEISGGFVQQDIPF